jgi:tetratricopeptide (TPR) repeat protein
MNRKMLRAAVCAVLLVGCLCTGFDAEASVRHWEDTLTLPTYPWYDDVNPVFEPYEGDVFYPYTRQDHIAKSSESRSYRTLCLENEYLRVVCIPELGGRIHSVVVKATGEEMFHRNDEIKPALIAMRGAWIGGGIEWNPGPHGHTVTILSPVDVLVRENRDRSITLVVGNTEKMFRTRWTVELTLHPGKSYLDETIRIYNPTDGIHPYYFWNCTAFPNLEGTRFIYPMTLGTDHDGRKFFRWPVHEGRDLTWLRNYDTMTSVFGYECAFDFFGAYDVNRDRGIVSHANHHELPGKKAWTWGKDDFGIVSQRALSDAGPVHAQYIEVQSGPLRTQSDYGMLRPGREVRWREYWYPVHGLGDGFEYATRDAAVQTKRDGNSLEVRIMATARHARARCTITGGEETIFNERVALSPESATVLRFDYVPDTPLDISLADIRGNILLRYRSPLEIPLVEPPDLTVAPAREDGAPTADEVYAKAFLLHSQTNRTAAEKAYNETLEHDPLHGPARCGLATLAMEKADWSAAREHAAAALKRDENDGWAWYLYGAAALQLGEYDAAKRAGYKAAATLDDVARGCLLAGRAMMRMGDVAGARNAFERAWTTSPTDTRARNSLLAALLADNAFQTMRSELRAFLLQDPTDFTLQALAALGKKQPKSFAAILAASAGETFFTAQEAACFLMDLGMYQEAALLLEAVLDHIGDDLMTWCYAAWCRGKGGDEEAARAHLLRAAALSTDFVLPSRPESLPTLEYASGVLPESAAFVLLHGHALAAMGRLDAAVERWRAAATADPSLSVAWRLLALHEWKKNNRVEEAVALLNNAVAARADDQILYRDKALLLAEIDRLGEGMALVENMPRTRDVRYDIYLWLARAYLDQKRHDDCIALLSTARFSNWEGHTTPHDYFVEALMARGRIAFEDGRYEDARADFERALTFPENLEVGARYELTDAHVRYWLGKTWQALGDAAAARTQWETGAKQRTSADPNMPFIRITNEQDDSVAKCREALASLQP